MHLHLHGIYLATAANPNINAPWKCSPVCVSSVRVCVSFVTAPRRSTALLFRHRAVSDERYGSPLLNRLSLVSHTDEVGAEFLDCVGGRAGLYCLRVVCDEEGLFRLDDDDAFSSLCLLH